MATETMPPLLLCLDLEAGSEQLVAYAARHARRCGQAVHILHVSNTALDDETRAALMARIRAQTEGPLADTHIQGIDLEVGTAEDRIVEVAQRCRADPVLLGRRQRATVERIYVGSTTSAVISLATQPVLVVPVADMRAGQHGR